MIASAIEVAQKTHRQLTFSVMKPPAIGPTAGPRSGARLYMLIALPLSSARQQSLRTPVTVADVSHTPLERKIEFRPCLRSIKLSKQVVKIQGILEWEIHRGDMKLTTPKR